MPGTPKSHHLAVQALNPMQLVLCNCWRVESTLKLYNILNGRVQRCSSPQTGPAARGERDFITSHADQAFCCATFVQRRRQNAVNMDAGFMLKPKTRFPRHKMRDLVGRRAAACRRSGPEPLQTTQPHAAARWPPAGHRWLSLCLLHPLASLPTHIARVCCS